MFLNHKYIVYPNYVNKSKKDILALYLFCQEINKILPFLGLGDNSRCFSVTIFFSAVNDCRKMTIIIIIM